VSTPYKIGQVSPDGRWRWDGTRWIPSGRRGYQPRRGSLRWSWLVTGGCVWLLVVSVMLAVVAVHAFHVVQSSYTSCLPHDFPTDPSANLRMNFDYVGTGLPEGDSHECQQTLQSGDSVAKVDAFYASHLDSGDWQLVHNFAPDGPIVFQRISRPLTSGTIEFGPIQFFGGVGAKIKIRLDS
jgi:hypothetical protein